MVLNHLQKTKQGRVFHSSGAATEKAQLLMEVICA